MSDTPKAMKNPRRSIQFAVLVAAALVFLINVALGSSAEAPSSAETGGANANVVENDAGMRFEPSPESSQQPAGDFSKFSHTNPLHSRMPCLLCHKRADNSPVPVRSLGHSPCVGCHAQQFSDPRSPICSICHTDSGSSNPPVKPFPSLYSFSVRFDHARHSAGAARANCTTCHKPSGRVRVALSIPSATGAHATCFQCHTPRAVGSDGRDISSCDTCHQLGRHARTPAWSSAYTTTPFSHAAHTRKGLACAECHTVRAGAPQTRQVGAPFPAQHHAPAGTRSCASCHDNKRAFGGDDFDDCTRCHHGSAWHF
jgi:c(7)-type cytochrome triheme protein